MNQYDVTVIGAGATGGSIAWQLSHYDLQVALVDRCADASFGVSKANSGIVHGGFHHSADSTLKAKLELEGNEMFDELQKELDFEFTRCGILVVAYSDEELPQLQKLYERGVGNKVPGIEMCSRERLLELEPKLTDSAVAGFFVPRGGVIEPYGYVFSLVESAELNGVEFWRSFQVTSAEKADGYRILTAADGRKIRTRFVVNAAGLYADEVSRICGVEEFEIRPRKGEEYLLDRTCPGRPSKVIFPVPTPCSKGMLVIPTAGGTTMIGPSATMVGDKEENDTTQEEREIIFEHSKKMVKGISERDLVAAFSGLRPVLPGNEDFFITRSEKAEDLIQAAGIQSPGLTASPAIGVYVRNILAQCGVEMKEKTAPRKILPPKNRARELSPEELDKLHADEKLAARIICRCEFISEAEIVAAVRRGHVTLDGVKFRTRAGMGRCQGGFCAPKIMQIISRESGIPMEELTKRGPGSELLAGRLGSLEVK